MKQVHIPKPRRAKKKLLKVNLGCGGNIVKGFVNIDDFLITDNPDFLRGNAKNIPLETGTVDYLVCDQMLEHIPMADIHIVLSEIRRVLKEGAKCVIIVPDFRDAAEEWLRHNHNEGFNPLVYRFVSDPIYGNQNHGGEFHQTPMSAGFLHHSLNAVGLSQHSISFWPRNGAIPSFDGMIPYAPKAVLRNAQLVVEITR